MPQVVIVGGGVIGCATAYFLAKNGASVTLLERGELAGEASGAAAGMLAALSDEGGSRGPEFQQLCLDGLDLYESVLPVLDATGVDLRYSRAGVLHLALINHEAEPLKRRYEQQLALAPDNRWLEGDALREEEPQAQPHAVAGLLSPREHFLDPQRLTLAFAEAARREGASIQTQTAVTGLVQTDGKVSSVRTAGGRIEAASVLLSGGPWTAGMAAKLGAFIPVRPVRGQMISLRGPKQPLRHVIWGEHAYLVPREDGQTFVGATVEEVGFRRRNTLTGLARLRRAATELVPALKDADLVRSWSGLRPGTPDGLPILGQLPGHENVWVATGHFRNGILLAPITGQLMAEGIRSGETPARLQPFSPLRFVS
ncbi:MAG: glycine oxidase ThiO [Dehalococcoidia bacterium]